MTKIARFCGIFCLVGILIGIVWEIISTVYPTGTGSTFTNDFVILTWAIFGYTIYGYSLPHKESNLDFAPR